MDVVKKELELPKELSEVATLVVELVKDLVAKKEIALIASENLPLLMTAVEGYAEMKLEMEDPRAYNVVAVMVADLMQVLKKKQ